MKLLLLKIVSLFTLVCSQLSAQSFTFTTPVEVIGDAIPFQASWFHDGNGELIFRFDTSTRIGPATTITSATIRVVGQSLNPSWNSEIVTRLSAPSGQQAFWNLGDLRYPAAPGAFDTGPILRTTQFSGTASGIFEVSLSETFDDQGNDQEISSIALTIVYESNTSVFESDIGSFLNNAFPDSDPNGDASQLPSTLSETGAFQNLTTLQPTPGLIPYELNTPFWSDNALKNRWLALPKTGIRDTSAEQITFNADEPWNFPPGTVAVKHFELPINESNSSVTQRLETRFIVALEDGNFYGLTYRWREDGSDADLELNGSSLDVPILEIDGTTRIQQWNFPSQQDCRQCHNSSLGAFLGLRSWQLNREVSDLFTNENVNQLEMLADAGFFANSLDTTTLLQGVAVDDTSATLVDRVRSYLASNCAGCHNDDDGLNTNFDLRHHLSLEETGLLTGAALIDLGIIEPALIKPQDPDSSVIYRRIDTLGSIQMPPLGRDLIDEEGAAILAEWINSLPPTIDPSGNPPTANNDDAVTVRERAITLLPLTNDLDVDGDTFSVHTSTEPQNGSAIWNSDNSILYTPNPDFIGTDQWTYQLIDSTGAFSEFATITVVVSQIADNTATFIDSSFLLPDPSSFSGLPMGIADMNQDGRDDIVRMRNNRDIHIDHQNADGSFSLLSVGTPSATSSWGMSLGDIDNDGFPEIITGGFEDGLFLMRTSNQGTSYQMETLNGPTIFLQAAGFTDYDNDGNLDFMANHDLGRNSPYRNNGSGTLLYTPTILDNNPPGADNSQLGGNYGLIWSDYDNDGDQDLYITKCRNEAPTGDPRRINQLFQRQDNGTYLEVASTAGVADGAQSWTADFGDIDNDGDLDLFIGNHNSPSALMINQGNGTFVDEGTARGISLIEQPIQTIFRDFNSDGWVDLVIVGDANEMWLNDRDGTFTSVGSPFTSQIAESAAVGDLNHDGFTDIYAGHGSIYNNPNPNQPDRLFLNATNSNRFLSVTLLGEESNRLAIGARIELHGSWGTQVREVRGGEGYGISHAHTQQFGLGIEDSAEMLIVRWPSGTVDTFHDVSANQFLTITERETFLLNLNAEQLQAYAFGSESALADETQPVLVNFEDGNYVMSFLVRNGGQENTDGYSTDEISYHLEFTPSLDEEWIAVDLQTVTNSSGLPTPPTGYTYLSHQLQTTEEPKLFVRVRIEVN